MRLFKDIFSDCNLASDAFPHEIVYNGAAIKFTAKFITKVNDYGALPEGEGDTQDADGETVIDLVDSYQLHTVEGYKVNEWLAVIKKTMQAIMARVKEQGVFEGDKDKMKEYQKGCVEFVNFIKGKFDEVQIYQGDIGEYEGTEQSFGYAMNENQDNPLELSFYFFKDGLIDEKY